MKTKHRRWMSWGKFLIGLGVFFLAAQLAACGGKYSSINDADYRKAQSSSDQAALADIALESKNQKARNKAAGRLTDQEKLFEVFSNSSSPEVREITLGRITSQPILSSIAQENQWWYYRQRAVSNLTDQVILAGVATHDPSKKVRLSAVERLHNQNVLAEIINKTTRDDYDLLLAAVKNTTDQAVLGDIVLGKGRWYTEILDNLSMAELNALAQAVIKNLIDQKVLAQILMSEESPVRKYNSATLKTALQKINDLDVTAEIAQGRGRSGKLLQIRGEAVLRLNNQTILSMLALDEEDIYIRRIATTRLTDKASLQRVIAKHTWAQADLAKLVLFLIDPVIRSHAPNLEVKFRFSPASQDYSYYGYARNHSIRGESIGLTVRRSNELLGSWNWQTKFPELIPDKSKNFIHAPIDFDDLMDKLSSALGLTANDKIRLSRESPVEEVRDFFNKSVAR